MRALALAVVACASQPVVTEAPPRSEPAAAPLAIEAGGFPLPPHQRDGWVGPSTPLAAATQQLCGHGLADPRGLPYGEIAIAIGDVWQGDAGIAKVHGWAFGDWGIAWNGLVYPLHGFVKGGDVATDMRATIAKSKAARDKWNQEHPSSPYRMFSTLAESYATATDSVTATKAALLTRLGDDELATAMWAELSYSDDPFLAIASEWMWSLFDRAVTAHMKGDDALAASATKPLVRLRSILATEVAAHGAKDPMFPWLEPLDMLAADTDRRLANPHVAMPDLAKLDPDARVAALIAQLDEVKARQDGQPGGVDLAMDPIVQQLIAQGTIAVEPLIDVIERDTRLTRSVHFHRDFHAGRSLIGVHEAAYVAISGILQERFFDVASTGDDLSGRGPEGRKRVADAIRAYWDKWKSVPLAERWYLTLADDGAKPDEWVAAASKLTRPSNVEVLTSSMIGTTTITSSEPSTGVAGEALRHHAAPSVTELLDKRIHQGSLDVACALTEALGRWDPAVAGKTLVETTTRAIAASKGTPGNQGHWQCIVGLTRARTDGKAIADYAAWIRTVTPTQDNGWNVQELFAPMIEHATDKAIAEASDVVFGKGSPWVPLTAWERDSLLTTDLVKVRGFRAHVLAGLADLHEVGTTHRTSDTRVDIELTGVFSTADDPSKDARAPAVGTHQTFRLADFYASRLASRPGAPRFALYWSVADRDAALASFVAYVKSLN